MTIANVTKTHADYDVENPSFTHTPVGGDPRGVLVVLAQDIDDRVPSAVTYGGISMAEVTGSPNRKSTGEAGLVSAWFLGTGIPTGAQTVTITAAIRERLIACYSVTANGDMVVEDTDVTINSDSVANPTATLSLGGRVCFCAQAVYSGTTVTAVTGWTADQTIWQGAGHHSVQSFDTIGSTDVTAGWTQGADDAVGIGVAIREAAAAAAITSVGGDDVVVDAEQNVAFITTGFASEISTVQLVSGTSITNATGVTSTSGTGDFDLPDITGYVVDTVGCPLTTANNVVVARLTDA